MVTSAGSTSFETFTDITPEQWDRMLAVNLTGTFHCVQAAIPDMIAGGWGRIVHDLVVERAVGRGAHGALRRVEGRRHRADQGAGARVAPTGITVNTIPPGFIDTPMARRAEEPGDLPTIERSRRAPRCAEPGRPTTSRPRARSCAPTTRATSPAR